MLRIALYAKLSSKPPTQPFKKPATYSVGVGGASAKVKRYVHVTVQLVYIEVAHPFLVVSDLYFPILVRTGILREHSATMFLGNAIPL